MCREARTTPPPAPSEVAEDLEDQALELEEMAQRLIADAESLRVIATRTRAAQ